MGKENNMKVSVVIPYMEVDPEKREVLHRLTKSLKGHDEIVVVSNWKEGYAVPINKGFAVAQGDYMIVMNDDLIQLSGSLRDLCDPEAVTSPLVDGKEQPFWGCCFCVPRWVYEKTGGLWEGYRISYFDDDDFINVLRLNEVPMKSVPSVNFENVDGGGRTLHAFPDHNEFFEENRKRYEKRWGAEPQIVNQYYEQFGTFPKVPDES